MTGAPVAMAEENRVMFDSEDMVASCCDRMQLLGWGIARLCQTFETNNQHDDVGFVLCNSNDMAGRLMM
jgi:hypothetical protein